MQIRFDDMKINISRTYNKKMAIILAYFSLTFHVQTVAVV